MEFELVIQVVLQLVPDVSLDALDIMVVSSLLTVVAMQLISWLGWLMASKLIASPNLAMNNTVVE